MSADTSANFPDITVQAARLERQRFAHYQIGSCLGCGTMGMVFEAHDGNLNRVVALKVLADKPGMDPAIRREQFLREARSAARLSHPNVVMVFEVGRYEQHPYIAMELLPSGTLFDLIVKKARVSIRQTCKWFAQAAAALAHAHANHILHRDVKPPNFMLATDYSIKLTDFGLALLDDPTDSFRWPVKNVGTPLYAAPEVALGQPTTELSDLYSLGATLYFTLTGQHPYNGATNKEILSQHVHAPVPAVADHRRDVPPELCAVVTRCMSKKPADRYASAAQLADVLVSFVDRLRF